MFRCKENEGVILEDNESWKKQFTSLFANEWFNTCLYAKWELHSVSINHMSTCMA